MTTTFSLATKRLHIRSWLDRDSPAYAQINADPRVREFLGETLTRAQSDAQIDAFRAHEQKHGFTFWALERRDAPQCIGFVGLQATDYIAHFTPAVEIGWRLDPSFWGNGFASEAASAVLTYAFENLPLQEIVAVTVPQNTKSRAVMTRLGMTQTDTFTHPHESVDHPLATNLLYRIKRSQHHA